MPTSVLDTKTYIEQVQKIHKDILESHGVKLEIIKGTELRDRGFGGLWGVGKAAEQPPALVILSHLPKGATKTMCWVGKGIVYDTGGLSIKTPSTNSIHI